MAMTKMVTMKMDLIGMAMTKRDTTVTMASMMLEFTKKLVLNTTPMVTTYMDLMKMGMVQEDTILKDMTKTGVIQRATTKTDMTTTGVILKERLEKII